MPKQRNLRYIEIANILKEEIKSEITYGNPIQSERSLAERFGVSRDTVRKALSVLHDQNIITKKTRSGSFPLPSVINRDLQYVRSISEDFEPFHLNYTINIIDTALVQNLPDEFNSDDKDFHKITRAIYLEDTCTIYEEHYLPAAIFPEFPPEAASNIFAYVEKTMTIKDSNQSISIQTPPAAATKLFPSSPLMHISSYSTLDDGRIFQYTSQFFHPNYKFNIKIIR